MHGRAQVPRNLIVDGTGEREGGGGGGREREREGAEESGEA